MGFKSKLHGPGAHLARMTLHVSRSLGNQSIPSGVETLISWDTEHFDAEGLYPSINWGAPFAFGDNAQGVWIVQANVMFAANVTGVRRLRFENAVGGVQDARTSVQALQAGATWLTLTQIIDMPASGLGSLGLGVGVFQDSGVALDIQGAGTSRARLQCWRLSGKVGA